MRILALKWRRLGDTVLWTAALQALREWAPDAAVDVAAPSAYLPLFAEDPRFADRIALTEDGGAMRRLARELAGRRYDVVLNFHASPRSRGFAEAVGGGLRLIHHHDRSGKIFGSQRPIRDAGRPASAIERDLNVVRTLGWNGPSPSPRVALAESCKRRGEDLWGKRNRPRIAVAPFASRPSKQWPLERFAQLAERVASEADLAVLHESPSLFDGRRLERGRLERFARLIATPALEDAAGLLAGADRFVGCDSGLKHLAAALGVPTVTLFGPESVGEWHGYGEPHRAIQKEARCRDRDAEDARYAWCGETVCPLASHACLTRIGVAEVAAAVVEKLPFPG